MADAEEHFQLEVFAFDVELLDAKLRLTPSSLALAFQFLDYPLLLTYAGSSNPGGQIVNFSSGKSCIFTSDADELHFLLEQVSQTELNLRVTHHS